MFFLFIILITVLFIFAISTIIVNFPTYKYYKPIFEKLPTMKFEIHSDQVWSVSDMDFVYFIDDGTIKLTSGEYIHSGSLSYFDPYSLYYYIKFNRYMKKWIKNKEMEHFRSRFS